MSDITHMAVWGNHSPTMYPDLFNAKVRGERAWDAVGDEAWVADEFIPRVGKRGAEIIEARGASSAASAANAAIDHVHDWVKGTEGDDWVSMAVPSPGAYGVEEGIISSFPCRTRERGVGDRRRASTCPTSRASGSTARSTSSRKSATPCGGSSLECRLRLATGASPGRVLGHLAPPRPAPASPGRGSSA